MSMNKIKNNLSTEVKFVESYCSKMFCYPFQTSCKTKVQTFGFNFIRYLLIFTQYHLAFTLCFKSNSFIEIVNIAPNIGVCLMSSLRIKIIFKNGDLYQTIFNYFVNQLWDTVSVSLNANIKLVMKYISIIKVLNRCIIYYSGPLTLLVISIPILIMKYENYFKNIDPVYLYPYDAWYPFDKIKWYYVIYIWESFMTSLVIALYSMCSLVYITTVLFICLELKLINNNLQNFINDDEIQKIVHNQNTEEVHCGIKRKLNAILTSHNFLVRSSMGIDVAMQDMMLLNYCIGSVFICLTAFTFTVVDDLYCSIRYFSFFISLLVDVFLLCIYGQVLSDHSEAITNAAYTSNWIYADNHTKKIIMMLIMRAQKPLALTAGRIYLMNLSSFAQICTMSYKAFNMLRTLYG